MCLALHKNKGKIIFSKKKDTSMILVQNNPWNEENHDSYKTAMVSFHQTLRNIQNLEAKLPELKAGIQTFIKDMNKVVDAWGKEKAMWRADRALTVVHLPTLQSALEGLAQTNPEHKEQRKALARELKVCMQGLAQNSQKNIGQSTLLNVQVETATLLDALDLDAPDPEPEEASSGWFGKAKNLGGNVWSQGQNMAGNSLDVVGKTLSTAADKTSKAVTGGTSYLTTKLQSYVEDGVDFVTAPITTRASAAVATFTHIGVGAFVVGGLVAILVPPAAPFAAGLVALEAPDVYKQALAEEQANQRRKKSQRTNAYDAQIQTAVEQMGLSSTQIAKMETPFVMVSINTNTGESDGVFLTGRYMGERFSEQRTEDLNLAMTTAPDNDTAQILKSWIKGHR
jgi:hypothetical protein